VTIHVDTGGWGLGWDALVALGTLSLAGVTAYVAWQTRRLAERTQNLATETTELAKRTAEDVAGQVRPVLVNDTGQNLRPARFTRGDQRLDLDIRNAGKGPALNIEARARSTNEAPGTGVEPVTWHRAALPADEKAALRFFGVDQGADGRLVVELRYRGLDNSPHTSVVTVEVRGDPPVVLDVDVT
jgi:hypothetical protein